MTFQERLERAYQSLILRLYRYFLPICLLLSYWSAFNLLHPDDAPLLGHLVFLSFHRVLGLVLLLFLLVMLYDWVQEGKPGLSSSEKRPLRIIVNQAFLIFLEVYE